MKDHAQTYKIERVQDFLKVPEDRLGECLLMFRDYLDTARAVKRLGGLLNVKDAELGIGCFNWCDDGIRKGTLIVETRVKP
jgi:hypothetical protein